MKYKIFILLIAISLFVSGCSSNGKSDNENTDIMDLDERFRRAAYASDLQFGFSDYYDAKRWVEYGWELSNKYKAIYFVHSKEEWMDAPDDVIVLWPDPDPPNSTAERLETINREIEALGIDLESYSLCFPITLDDLVDNWEKVDTLLVSELIHISEDNTRVSPLNSINIEGLRQAMYLITLEDGKESENAFAPENYRRNPRRAFEIYYELYKTGNLCEVEMLKDFVRMTPDFPETPEQEAQLNELRESFWGN